MGSKGQGGRTGIGQYVREGRVVRGGMVWCGVVWCEVVGLKCVQYGVMTCDVSTLCPYCRRTHRHRTKTPPLHLGDRSWAASEVKLAGSDPAVGKHVLAQLGCKLWHTT